MQKIFSMSYRVKTIPKFEKNLKRLVKKYPSLKEDFSTLVAELKNNPRLGSYIGNNCYKIRLAISSKGKGKSGGARVITFIKVTIETVYLLSIYDKSERVNISARDLKTLLQNIR